MKKTAYQIPELRDENNNIIQNGAFGRKTAFVTADNQGVLDYIMNDLEALKDMQTGFSATVAKQIGEKVSKSGDTITGPILYDKTPNDDSELPNKAYVDSTITSKTTSAIDKHNKDGNAHNGILQKVATLGESVLQKLALTTTISAISALQTNSWFGQMLKMVLTASGVKYNIAENGYVCFGAFFGGAIIQWGYSILMPKDSKTLNITYPVAFSRIPTAIYLTGHGGALGTLCWISSPNGVSGFAIASEKAGDGSPNSRVSWLVVGS